jgi:hypothetical protein
MQTKHHQQLAIEAVECSQAHLNWLDLDIKVPPRNTTKAIITDICGSFSCMRA